MALWDLTCALTTTGTTLASLVGSTTANHIGIIKQLSIQPHFANTGVVRLGGTSTTQFGTVVVIDNTNFGVELPVPVSSVPCAPFPIGNNGGVTSLSQVSCIGQTTTDKIHLLLETA